MSQQLPPQLAQMLGAGAGAGDAQDANPGDPLSTLQDAIHSVTECMVALTDPQDTQDAIKALQILSAVQTRLMKGATPGASQPPR